MMTDRNMTAQEKLKKIEALITEYKDNEAVFAPPADESAQQKEFREDLRAITSIVFDQDQAGDIPTHFSAAEIKERLKKIWEDTKSKI